ncbi:hypothetical protein SAMN05421543_1212 [Alicyclobacillus macrosporangiidus]|uniref:Uncharacterized protein n=1 Tax=Alicyclobacillus macrosporangiidus TaxID=392015 RepID=A0A1I7KYD9_9BACL|nr:hypothetical protein SAMN05421543_1212 [Alicyclobacillus macrosporangiidus]
MKEPLRAELAFHDLDETWELVCPELHISCVGNDPPALREEFSNDFDVLWHEYACAQDDELTPGGIRLKRKLHALVDFIQSGV